MTEMDTKKSYDESEHTEHSDFDLDNDLRRMSVAALSALESITDEVNEIENKQPRKTSRPSLGEHFRTISENEKSSTVTPSPYGAKKSHQIQHIDDIDVSDGEDEDDASLDFSLDGSIAKELEKLRSVSRKIERELSNEDGSTMRNAISRIDSSDDDPKKRVLTSDDRDIIEKAIADEMHKYEPKNAWERIMKRYHLEGIGEKDKTIALVTLCTVVWSIVLRLLYKVQYGEI